MYSCAKFYKIKTMKKIISFGLVFVLILSSCSLFDGGNIKETRNREDLEAYLNRESDFEMQIAGPFYFGNFDGLSPISKEYSEIRRERVEEIVEIMDESFVLLRDIDKKLREMRSVFASFVEEIKEIEPASRNYANQLLTATNIAPISSSLSNAISLERHLKDYENTPEWGFLQFQRYASIFKLSELYLMESASLLQRALMLSTLAELDKSNEAFAKVNDEFVLKMDKVSEEVNDLLNELMRKNAMLVYADQVLFSADIDFARKTLASIDLELSKMEGIFKAGNSNENLSDEFVEIFKRQYEEMKIYRDSIFAYISSVPESELLALESNVVSNSFFNVAFASDWPSYLQGKISDAYKTAKFAKDMTFAAVRLGGKKLKEGYDESGAHEFIKDGAQILNGGLEIVNSGVAISIYGIQGIYFGDMDLADFKRRIEEEKAELHKRFLAGTLGKDQYDEIIHQVNQFQRNTGVFIENMSELAGDMTFIVGGDAELNKFIRNVTRGVGNEAKKALDTATDFTKNLAIVMHPETSKEDTRKALVDILVSLKGVKDKDGNYIKVEMPDLIELVKEQASKELGFSQEEEASFVEQLQEIMKDELKGAENKKEDLNKKDDNSSDSGEGSQDGAGGEEPSQDQNFGNGGNDSSSKDNNGEGDSKSDVYDPNLSDDELIQNIADILNNPNISEDDKADQIVKQILRTVPPKNKDDYKDPSPDEFDIDKDGVFDDVDNCPSVYNPDQKDTDGDGIGDACDPDCSGDADLDGVCDEVDNCPTIPNPDQRDSNNNGIGDLCDDSFPELSEIIGQLKGNFTIHNVYVSDSARTNMKEEGCDPILLEETKGKTYPSSVNISQSGDNAGTLTFKAEGDSIPMPFVYENGVLRASKKQDGALIDITIDYRSGEPVSDIKIDYMEGQAVLSGSMNLK